MKKETQKAHGYTEVFTWGSDSNGQMGLAGRKTGKTYPAPRFCSFNVIIRQISCGEDHSAFITNSGYVYTMGSNLNGKLGISERNVTISHSPCLVNALSQLKAVRISCGWGHTAAVIDNGDLYCWGKGSDGQLGVGSFDSYNLPQKVDFYDEKTEAMVQVSTVDVDCGARHTGVLSDRGELFMFGAGEYGQLGTGRMDRESIPFQIKLGTRIRKVSCGYNHTLALTEAGKIYSTGGNLSGQLGIGTKKVSLVFAKIAASENVIFRKISAGSHSAAISTQGELYLWGAGSFGEYLTPQRILGFKTGLKRVSIGNGFGCAIDVKGNIFSWGHNNHGELGNGDYESRIHPKQIPSLDGKRVTSVSCGGSFVLALGNTLHYSRDEADSQTERELAKSIQDERANYQSQSQRRTDKSSDPDSSVKNFHNHQRKNSRYEEEESNSSIHNQIPLEKYREHNDSKRMIYSNTSDRRCEQPQKTNALTASFARNFSNIDANNLTLSKRQSFVEDFSEKEIERSFKLISEQPINLKRSPEKVVIDRSRSRNTSISRDHSHSRVNSLEKYNSLPQRDSHCKSPNQTEVSSASPNRSPIKLEVSSIKYERVREKSSEKKSSKKASSSGIKNPALRKRATPEQLKSDPRKKASPSLKKKFDRLTEQLMERSPSRNLTFSDASFISFKEEVNNKTADAQGKEITALKKIIYDLRAQIATLEKENSSVHEKVLESKIQNLEESCTVLKQDLDGQRERNKQLEFSLHSERKKVSALENQIEECKKVIIALESDTRRTTEKTGRSRLGPVDIERERDYYRRLAEDLSAKIEKQAYDYGESIGKKEAELHQMLLDKRVLEAKIDEMTSIVRELTTIQEEDKKTMEELFAKQAQSHDQIKRLNKEKQEANANYERLEAALQQNKKNYENHLQNLNKSITHREEGAIRIEEEFLNLKRLNNQLTDENQNLQDQLDEKLEIIHDLKKLITSLEDSLVFRGQAQISLQGSIHKHNKYSPSNLEGIYNEFHGESNIATNALSTPPFEKRDDGGTTSEERRASVLKKDAYLRGNQLRRSQSKSINFNTRSVEDPIPFSPNERGSHGRSVIIQKTTNPSERSSPVVTVNPKSENSFERRRKEDSPRVLPQKKLQVRAILSPRRDENIAPNNMQPEDTSERNQLLNREASVSLQSRLLAAFPPRASSRENSAGREKKSPHFESNENQAKILLSYSDGDSRTPLSDKTHNENSQGNREQSSVQSRLEVVEMSLGESRPLITPDKKQQKVAASAQHGERHKTSSPPMKENINQDPVYYTAYKSNPSSSNLTELQTKLQSLQESKTKLERRMKHFEQKLKETEKD